MPVKLEAQGNFRNRKTIYCFKTMIYLNYHFETMSLFKTMLDYLLNSCLNRPNFK